MSEGLLVPYTAQSGDDSGSDIEASDQGFYSPDGTRHDRRPPLERPLYSEATASGYTDGGRDDQDARRQRAASELWEQEEEEAWQAYCRSDKAREDEERRWSREASSRASEAERRYRREERKRREAREWEQELAASRHKRADLVRQREKDEDRVDRKMRRARHESERSGPSRHPPSGYGQSTQSSRIPAGYGTSNFGSFAASGAPNPPENYSLRAGMSTGIPLSSNMQYASTYGAMPLRPMAPVASYGTGQAPRSQPPFCTTAGAPQSAYGQVAVRGPPFPQNASILQSQQTQPRPRRLVTPGGAQAVSNPAYTSLGSGQQPRGVRRQLRLPPTAQSARQSATSSEADTEVKGSDTSSSSSSGEEEETPGEDEEEEEEESDDQQPQLSCPGSATQNLSTTRRKRVDHWTRKHIER